MSCKERHGLIGMLSVMLAACAYGPKAPPPPPPETLTAEGRVLIVRAAATGADDELEIQPLRDPNVEDLRETAKKLEGERRYPQAAAALDQALSINSNDPLLLQERAEIALLQRDFEAAETLARRAYAQGSKVGPLCRRHWATIEQVLKVRLPAEPSAAAHAREQITACTVSAPNRF